MPPAFRKKFTDWLFRPKTEHGTVVLTQRRVFILPTRQGFAMALLLTLMLLGDINYNLSMGYVLTFLLTMMALVSMLHAYRNLAQLEIRAGRADPVFAGDAARFMLHIHNPGDRPRYSLVLDGANGFDVPPRASRDIACPVKSTRRGYLKAGRLTLYTEFPLGLFHAWCYLNFDMSCLVYPKPCDFAPLPPGADGTNRELAAGDEDFAGLRDYAPGDALPRIAWKSYAKGQPLQVKQFSDPAGESLLLDLAQVPGADLEDRLSRLTRWVLDAEAQGLVYAIKLADYRIAAGAGAQHRDICLRNIALFGLGGA